MKKTLAMSAAIILAGSLMPSTASAIHSGPQEQTLKSPSLGSTDEVAVGIDDLGTATAVWTETGTIRYATRGDGEIFGPTKTVGRGSTGWLAFDESSNGNAVIGWTSGGDDGEIAVSVRIGRDAAFSAPQTIVPAGADGASSVDVAMSNAGRAVVVWHHISPQYHVDAALSDNNGIFAGPQTLSSGDYSENPMVDIDDTGRAFAVWDRDSATVQDRIQGAVAGTSGGFGPAFTIESNTQGAGFPAVAVNASGAAVVVWSDLASTGQNPGSLGEVIEAVYGSVTGTLGPLQTLTEPSNAMGTGDCEAAVDDSGVAGVICGLAVDDINGLHGWTSDANGAFGTRQVVTPFDVAHGPSIARKNFAISAGFGGFTVAWSNDEDLDLVNEVYTSDTTAGAFGPSHRVSPLSGEQAERASVARVLTTRCFGCIDVVVIWRIYVPGLSTSAQASPIYGTPPTYGTAGDDAVSGTPSDDTIYTGDGADTVSAGDGDDTVYGEGGDDSLTGGGGADLLSGGGGSDELFGDGAVGGGRYDVMMAGGAADRLLGGGGKDLLYGGAGKDFLNGGKGFDTCIKSRGDTYKSCERFKRAH